MSLPRRSLLKIGISGALLLSVGGLGLSLRPTTMVTKPESLKCLDQRQFSVLQAVAECMVAPSGSMPSVIELEVVQTIDGLLVELHPADRKQVLQVVGLLENALSGLLMDGRFQTFTGSDLAARRHILDGWRTSRLSVKRQAFLALHQLCVSAYWGHPRAYEFAGYGGPPDYSGVLQGPDADG